MRLKLLALCGAALLTGCVAVPYDSYYGDGYGYYGGAPYVSGTFVYRDYDRNYHYKDRGHRHRHRHHDDDRYYHDNHRRRGRAWDRD